jgi:site-specific DNA recombinase
MKTKPLRCAIYTRKSTEEGLDKEFTSLDAQRESAEAYIKSQAALGWVCLPMRYDDGGFTGGNMERPALKRLLADVERGKLDLVLTNKVDRLSRSLLDFARMMAIFEAHHVSFVSVTQQFNTATSMGRLVLNVLLSFAQFEREIISERTRDKIAAARRKGKWAGGMPLLGYDVERSKLVVNEGEAAQVREIFELYLKHQGLIPVVQELDRLGWRTKRWVTRKGKDRGGQAFTKTNLHHVLTNVVYLGKVKYRKDAFPGEHQPIVDAGVWRKVQDLLRDRGKARTSGPRQPSAALLRGLLFCKSCGSAMTPMHSTKRGRRYPYYACVRTMNRGRMSCPGGWIPADQIEHLVIDQLRQFIRQSRSAPADLNEHLISLADPELWAALSAAEQCQTIGQLVQRVAYDGDQRTVAITMRWDEKPAPYDAPKAVRRGARPCRPRSNASCRSVPALAAT